MPAGVEELLLEKVEQELRARRGLEDAGEDAEQPSKPPWA